MDIIDRGYGCLVGLSLIHISLTTQDMPNFDSLLASYGIADSGRLIVEGSADYVIDNNPLYIIPDLNSESKICESLASAGTNILTPAAMYVERLDTKRSTVNIETLASSSTYSYAKTLEMCIRDRY